MANAEIAGWGYQLGGDVKTTQELIDEHGIPSTPEETYRLTGIKERALCAEGENGVTLSVAAGKAALKQAGLEPPDIDLLILATTTNVRQVPGMSAEVQYELGMDSTPAFDLNAGCSGAAFALYTAAGLIKADFNKRIMVVGTDTVSTIADWGDKNSVLFGDASGAVILEATKRDCGMLGNGYLITRGEDVKKLYCELGGKLQMNGHEVFEKAVRIIPEVGSAALARAGLEVDDVDLLVLHQANSRITDKGSQKLGIPEGKHSARVTNYIEDIGNSSAATMLVAFCRAMDEGRIAPDDNLLFVGFGAGMTAAALPWRM